MAPTDKLEPLASDWVESVSGEKILTVAELVGSKGWGKVKEEIDAGIQRANEKAVSNVAKVKKWKLIEKEFSVDGGELGPSLKLRRFHVVEMYRNEIEKMYRK
jgi:long-chain-fatty-acid--CoA ligase ACSBG